MAIDIVGEILRKYPQCVVSTRQADAGRLVEVRPPGVKVFPVRLFVEWGDEPEALPIILDRIESTLPRVKVGS